MKLQLFNVDEFCENLPEVTCSKIYIKNGFHPDGLFSERIFGPVKTATCACGTYWGRAAIGQKCKACGVDIAYSSERRKRFAKIRLPFKVINPMMLQLIIRAGKNKFKNIIENMIYNDKIYGYYYDESSASYVPIENAFKDRESDADLAPVIPDGVTEVYTSVADLFGIIEEEAKINADAEPCWKFISENLDKFFIHNILVSPPEFRPTSKIKKAEMTDEVNKYYVKLLNYSYLEKDKILDTSMIPGITRNVFKYVQRSVCEFYDHIFKKMSKKTGLIRGYILGKRIDFSARAVIVPDPTLELKQCSIPYLMALELYKLDIINKVMIKKMVRRYDQALDLIEKCIDREDLSLMDIVRECVRGTYVLLNRQPTLHRMGILAFEPTINDGSVIKLHPLVCSPYNADFDGDQMAVYRPLSPEANMECEEKLLVSSNLISPSTNTLVVDINQDIILGLYLLTTDQDAEKVEFEKNGKIIITTEGRIKFNQLLPKDYIFFNQTIDKKWLRLLMNDIVKTYDASVVTEILDNIKKLGFMYTTKYGCTMSLKNMNFSESSTITGRIYNDETTSWQDKYNSLNSPQVLTEVKSKFPYSVFIESGSRGSWDQALQMIFTRGYVSNSSGEIVTTPIKNNLMNGLTREEFFLSCYGSRKGLLDVALNTGVSGYLTRKLVYCNVNLEMDLNLDDCGTTDTLNIYIPPKGTSQYDSLALARSFIGRVIIEKDDQGNPVKNSITYENYDEFIGKTICVRSPIFCKSRNICTTCYGKLADISHSKYVGIIASQALGEAATQLVLRTFHTSGVAKVGSKEEDGNKQQDIVNDLSLVKKILHCGYSEDVFENLYKLFETYSRHRPIMFVHYECVLSQMMRHGRERWRLVPDRTLTNYRLVSIESVPGYESYLLALAFNRPKMYLVDGLLESKDTIPGILEKIMMNKTL